MEIQTIPILKTQTPRVKCIITHNKYEYVIVCLFTGEIQVYDPTSAQLKKSCQICDVPIRTGAIIPSKDWILLGTDNGTILVLDIGTFKVLNTIKAHDDFIRKIAVDEENNRLVTVSDDNRTKLWEYKDDIIQISIYKDSKHFVMDACFCPSNSSQFLTASLDGRVRLYSVSNTKCVKTFKGHKGGINSIAFISSSIFVTGSDDSTAMVWDIKRNLPISVLKGHSAIINTVKKLKNGFATCSEDSTVKFWNDEYNLYETIRCAGRAWDILYKSGKIFIGSDEELTIFQEAKNDNNAHLADNRIFFSIKDTFCSSKLEEIGVWKELGELEANFNSFVVNSCGKMVAFLNDGSFNVYSTLGMRKRFSDDGSNVCFFGYDGFVYIKNQSIYIARKTEIVESKEIKNLESILYADEMIVIVNSLSTTLFSIELEELHKFEILAKFATLCGENYILMNDQLHIFDKNFKKIVSLNYNVSQFAVNEGVLFFTESQKTYYLLVYNGKYYVHSIKHCPNLIGVRNNIIYYFPDRIRTYNLDSHLINFQMDYFMGKNPVPEDHMKDRAIIFLECIGEYDTALSYCNDDNQKFEILLKLGRLEEAFKSSNSPIKFEKLGNKFFQLKDMKNAAKCFSKTNNLNSLLIADVFGEKKYLEYIGNMAKKSGKNNIAFMAFYKNKNYDICRTLLKDTPFYKVFSEFYCKN